MWENLKKINPEDRDIVTSHLLKIYVSATDFHQFEGSEEVTAVRRKLALKRLRADFEQLSIAEESKARLVGDLEGLFFYLHIFACLLLEDKYVYLSRRDVLKVIEIHKK